MTHKVQPATKASKGNTLNIPSPLGEDPNVMLARTVLRPTVRAAMTAKTLSKQFGELDINALVAELVAQVNLAGDGDLTRTEAMLVAQAHTLEGIFHELAMRSALNMDQYVNTAEIYMRLALKAQSQCRATIETLALMKNPQPVTFVRQANVAHGPQQVNNVPQPAHEQASRARESENPPNKLLEQQHGERLEPGTVQATVGADPAMATLAALNGPSNGAR